MKKATSLAVVFLSAVSLGACAAGSHDRAMMHGGMMNGASMQSDGKKHDCMMMQADNSAMSGDSHKPENAMDMAGCKMMGGGAKRAAPASGAKPPAEAEDHARHHPSF